MYIRSYINSLPFFLSLTGTVLDRYVFARPAGKRCFVVSTNGTTISRQRNGSVLHHFPSALPNGARTRDVSGSGQSYSILDCIFHEVNKFGCVPFFFLFEICAFYLFFINLCGAGYGVCAGGSNLLCY